MEKQTEKQKKALHAVKTVAYLHSQPGGWLRTYLQKIKKAFKDHKTTKKTYYSSQMWFKLCRNTFCLVLAYKL